MKRVFTVFGFLLTLSVVIALQSSSSAASSFEQARSKAEKRDAEAQFNLGAFYNRVIQVGR